MEPREFLDRTVAEMVGRGYTVSGQTDSSVTFEREQTPDCLLGCGLLSLGILPGLIYLAIASTGKSRSTVLASSTASGTEIVVSGDSWIDRRVLGGWATELAAGPDRENPGDLSYLRGRGRDPDLSKLREEKERQRVEEARKRARWYPHPDDPEQ